MQEHSTIPETMAEQTPRSHSVGDDDKRLFERFIDGDQRALMELFDRHHHRIYLYCLKMLGQKEAAEDMTQTMWEQVIRFCGQPRVVTAPVPLMLTIARNLCLNHIRSRRRFSPLDDLPESAHPVVTPREMSHMEELVALSLPKLPFKQREVLILHAYCGYSFEDISQLLEEPSASLRTRASRARAHLGRIISSMVGLEEDRENGDDAGLDTIEPEPRG